MYSKYFPGCSSSTCYILLNYKVKHLQWPHLCVLLTVHIGICSGNVYQVRGKQHNGLWLAGSAEWAALNNGAHWDQINKGYSFRWNWRNWKEEIRAYLSTEKMIFHNACMNSSKALGYSYSRLFIHIQFFFPLFPFIPVSVNAFSSEIGHTVELTKH